MGYNNIYNNINLGKKSSMTSASNLNFSVNSASADLYPDNTRVLRTGSRTNATGSYNGGGTGNKSISGTFSLEGEPLSSLKSIEYSWTNLIGPEVPPTVLTPYINIQVDFDPNGSSNLKVLVVCDDSLNASITNSIGVYGALVNNQRTYSWDSSQNVLIVGQTPPGPGGVAPDISVGASWLENSYKISDLIAANPDAKIVRQFVGDGGLPSGSQMTGIFIVSGDSGNVTKSGKLINYWEINGDKV